MEFSCDIDQEILDNKKCLLSLVYVLSEKNGQTQFCQIISDVEFLLDIGSTSGVPKRVNPNVVEHAKISNH
jgi:hypothetical protein